MPLYGVHEARLPLYRSAAPTDGQVYLGHRYTLRFIGIVSPWRRRFLRAILAWAVTGIFGIPKGGLLTTGLTGRIILGRKGDVGLSDGDSTCSFGSSGENGGGDGGTLMGLGGGRW